MPVTLEYLGAQLGQLQADMRSLRSEVGALRAEIGGLRAEPSGIPPFVIPPVPLITAERARDVARAHRGLAQHLAELGVPSEAAQLERTSQWWMTYSMALGVKPSQGSPDGNEAAE